MEGLEIIANFIGAFIYVTYLLMVLFALLVYLLIGIFLNKYSKLVFNKKLLIAFIPFVNYYLLGKLMVNKLVGILLCIGKVLSSIGMIVYINTLENNIDLNTFVNVTNYIDSICNIAIFGLLIYLMVKYFELKKERKYSEKTITNNQNDNLNSMNNKMNNQNNDIEIL